jgi:hypothetical protein
MGAMDYQRTVIGYHGCDEQVAADMLAGKGRLEFSQNDYDWLGKGIYFWEHGPTRAQEWAHSRPGTGARIKNPSVIGAIIQLGNCFDLLDVRNTTLLRESFPHFKAFIQSNGLRMPENKSLGTVGDNDQVLRYLDCAFLNWLVDYNTGGRHRSFDTIRCLFSEGEPAFDGSRIMLKSHIQIAVRNPDCILGYFRPAKRES